MKKFSVLFTCLLLIGFAGSALADKNGKTIRHCGCVYDSILGVDMIFHDVFVAGNSQGHRNHLEGTTDACFAGLDGDTPLYEEWERDFDDCLISGDNQNLDDCDDDGIDDATQEEFDNCGTIVPVL